MDIQSKASECSITKEESSVELEPCAKDILRTGMQIVLLWSFFAVVTFGRSGWKAHMLMRKATSHEPMQPAAPPKEGEPKKRTGHHMLNTPLPPRGAWKPVTEEDNIQLTNDVEGDRIFDVDVDDVEAEMKRRNTYMPGSGLYNLAHTELGEVYPKLGKLQDNLDAKLRGGIDTARARLKKKEKSTEMVAGGSKV
jgi:hypothetical protein